MRPPSSMSNRMLPRDDPRTGIRLPRAQPVEEGFRGAGGWLRWRCLPCRGSSPWARRRPHHPKGPVARGAYGHRSLSSAAMSPLANRTIATVGSGVMAEAMIAGLLRGNLVTPDQVVASHPRAERRAALQAAHGIRVVASNVEAAADADVIILAVKPQMLARVGQGDRPRAPRGPARALGARRADVERPDGDPRPRPGRPGHAQHPGPDRQRDDRLVRDARDHRGPAGPGEGAARGRSAPSSRSRTRSGSRWRPRCRAPARPTCSS